ncbi:sensor histidine kinase [Streptomyces sp. NPDC056061]|uniref:sensor histidine kinase n=1 Tax=Streptomyces sp. NPDC056061 TaxID=3345700 RepID=UPI0035D66034
MSLVSRVFVACLAAVGTGWRRGVVEAGFAAAFTALVCASGLTLWVMPRPGVQLAAVAAAAVLYPLRRRHPVQVLLLSAALAGLFPFLGPVTGAIAHTVSRLQLPGRRRVGLWVLAAALPVGSAVVATAASWSGPASLPYALALGLVLAVTSVVVPGLVGTVFGQEDRLVEALRERADAAERARALADSEARTQERSRIASEMHDLVGHRLSLASLHVGGLELALAKTAPALRPDAAVVRTTVRDALRELRQTLGVLDPLGVNTQADGALTEGIGTRADVEELIAKSTAGGIDVRLEWTGPDTTEAGVPIRRAVHRLAREALTNVHRYATDAAVTVAVTHDVDMVRIVIHNTAPQRLAAVEGVGTGRGLPALRERVEFLGGVFTAGPLPDGGFRLAADLPTHTSGPATTGPSSGNSVPLSAPAVSSTTPAGRRSRRAMRALVLGGALVGLTALILVGIGFAYSTSPGRPPAPPEPRIGMTFDEFHGVGRTDYPGARAAAAGREPNRPAAAAGCVYTLGPMPDHRPADVLPLVRYCFDTARRLIAIDPFTVPTVHDSIHWESP